MTAAPLSAPEPVSAALQRAGYVDLPPVPREPLPQGRQIGPLDEPLFLQEVEWELARASRGGPASCGAGGGCLAYLELHELSRRREQWGAQVEGEIGRQVAALLQANVRRLEIAGRDAEGRFGILLPEQNAEAAQRRLQQLSRRVAGHPFTAGGERVRLTPVIGCAPFSPEASAEQLRQRALAALDSARTQLALHPVQSGRALSAVAIHGKAATPDRGRSRIALRKAVRMPLQILHFRRILVGRCVRATAAAIIGFGFSALPLAALMPSHFGAQIHPATPSWRVPWPSTPSQTAMREAAVWWAEAMQLANDEADEAREALLAWDPVAPFDAHVERQRFLAADHGGYVERALTAAHRAGRLAQTPAERERADRYRRIWETAAHRVST